MYIKVKLQTKIIISQFVGGTGVYELESCLCCSVRAWPITEKKSTCCIPNEKISWKWWIVWQCGIRIDTNEPEVRSLNLDLVPAMLFLTDIQKKMHWIFLFFFVHLFTTTYFMFGWHIFIYPTLFNTFGRMCNKKKTEGKRTFFQATK